MSDLPYGRPLEKRPPDDELDRLAAELDRTTGVELLVALAYASDAMGRMVDRYAAEGMIDQARDWAVQRAVIDRHRGR